MNPQMACADTGGSSPVQFSSTTARNRLEALVSALPDRYRLPLLLHYFHGMSLQDIAPALNTSIATIQKRLTRGIQRLDPKVQLAGLGPLSPLLRSLDEGKSYMAPPQGIHAASLYERAMAAINPEQPLTLADLTRDFDAASCSALWVRKLRTGLGRMLSALGTTTI